MNSDRPSLLLVGQDDSPFARRVAVTLSEDVMTGCRLAFPHDRPPQYAPPHRHPELSSFLDACERRASFLSTPVEA